MKAKNKRLTILSELEQFALYNPPDFDEKQRAEFLTFTETELQLILNRPDPTTQIYCAIQLGYFKAKQLFFHLPWEQIDEEDIYFLIQNYFPNHTINNYPITKHEYYYQCNIITNLFGYRSWSKKFAPLLYQQSIQIVKRGTTSRFTISAVCGYNSSKANFNECRINIDLF